ncbi:HupE/UreJ family protein [Cytophagales bacterium LB-30]|uniref:HupE/UreJ family protein n=1 Tax=Shiella aurantiaca TaxID=3058365 RepID=A0ABT8F994_9BACT|nr:HupE/UreJ family protein [Shiella aurantiaca]MDN4166766.1 HupE/UreJ family protein [Shiella aurantiaca]
MSEFVLYFQLGLDHILDTNGYDHILFVLALCTVYQLRDWRKVLILVTAFTIGHSVTLALSTFNLVQFNSELIEFLIPVTILVTAVANLFKKQYSLNTRKIQINYLFALLFGLIHGLGFSNYLKSLLGRNTSVVQQLLAFNLGIEAGQIIIVGIILTISFILVNLFNVDRRDWNLVSSSAIAGIALTMVLEAKYW